LPFRAVSGRTDQAESSSMVIFQLGCDRVAVHIWSELLPPLASQVAFAQRDPTSVTRQPDGSPARQKRLTKVNPDRGRKATGNRSGPSAIQPTESVPPPAPVPSSEGCFPVESSNSTQTKLVTTVTPNKLLDEKNGKLRYSMASTKSEPVDTLKKRLKRDDDLILTFNRNIVAREKKKEEERASRNRGSANEDTETT
jgi:hypothetical protein